MTDTSKHPTTTIEMMRASAVIENDRLEDAYRDAYRSNKHATHEEWQHALYAARDAWMVAHAIYSECEYAHGVRRRTVDEDPITYAVRP